MLIIAGLGNPGKEYENTRHNAGFMVMDALAEKIGADISEKKHKALCGKGVIAYKTPDHAIGKSTSYLPVPMYLFPDERF